jgi:hypothetical protein
MLNDSLKLKGELSIVIKDSNGNTKETRNEKNLVVDSGLAYICSRMVDANDGAMSHMGVGSGTTAAVSGNTDLESALGARVTLTSSNHTDNTVTYVATFSTGEGTGAITEAGIFNASTAGTMLCRTVFPVVNKGADDTMSITWTITLSAA